MGGNKLFGDHHIVWNQPFSNDRYPFAFINIKLKNPYINYKVTSDLFGP